MANENIHSIERALDIIELLASEPEGLGISAIAKHTSLAKSTAYRIVSTMQRRNYISKTDKGTYRIGLGLIESVSCYINGLELQTEARPYIGQITNELGLTAHLGILDGAEVIYVEKLDYFSRIRHYTDVGIRVPAYSCSLGKCLLANYSAKDIRNIFEKVSMQKITSHTITSIDELLSDLENVRKRGWAIDDEESKYGFRCLGAPVYDYRGDIIAAISASGSISVFPKERIQSVADFITEKALLISRSLGYVG